jgi:hypothetical protein
MDYLVEAKNFIRWAVDAKHVDVIRENLKLADWFLAQEIKERSGASDHRPTRKAANAL